MSDHVYKTVEVTGSSSESSDDAIRKAVAKASQSLRRLEWFEVIEERGHIDGGAVAHWQVTVKIGFRLED
jgi:flavin-binding protein dodecin